MTDSTAWYAKNPEKRKAHQLKWRLKQRVAPLEQLLKEQNGACAACQTSLIDLPKRQIHVDHCHVTKKIRGILCHHCNTALGLMKDDPAKIRKLAQYAEKHS